MTNLIEGLQAELKRCRELLAEYKKIKKGWSILAVPGGWIFIFTNSSCFVPRKPGPVAVKPPAADPVKQATEKKAPAKKKAPRKTSAKKAKQDGS
jgi:hypothetical protein